MAIKRKAGPKSWTAKTLESMRVFFVDNRGNVRKTAEKFNTSDQTIWRLAKIHKWREDIPKIAAETRELSNRSVAESHAVTLAAIDEFIDDQSAHAKAKRMRQGEKEVYGFDPPNFERMVKTRELLTGGATERTALDLSQFLDEWSKIEPEKRRELLALARSKRSTS